MKMDLLDCKEQVIREGDFIAYATTSRIWVGTVTKLIEYLGDSEDIYKIQIQTDEGKRTFEHLGWKIYKIKDA